MKLITKKQRTRALLAASLLAVIATACTPAQKPPLTAAGSGWALHNGQRGQLADYKGKVVLLDFYATWCEPCRVETPHLVALQQRYESRGFQIIGLNVGGVDDYEQVPAFAKEFRIQFPLAIPDDEFVDEYLGINQNIPQTFVLDRQGKVIQRFVGYGEGSAERLDRVIESTLARTQ